LYAWGKDEAFRECLGRVDISGYVIPWTVRPGRAEERSDEARPEAGPKGIPHTAAWQAAFSGILRSYRRSARPGRTVQGMTCFGKCQQNLAPLGREAPDHLIGVG
jgi:hypothetical protein